MFVWEPEFKEFEKDQENNRYLNFRKTPYHLLWAITQRSENILRISVCNRCRQSFLKKCLQLSNILKHKEHKQGNREMEGKEMKPLSRVCLIFSHKQVDNLLGNIANQNKVPE